MDKKFNELNLLPDKYRFNIYLQSILQKVAILGVINIIILSLIFMILVFQKKQLTKQCHYLDKKISEVSTLIQKIQPFINKKKNLLIQFSTLEKRKKLFYLNYSIEYSPFIATIILAENISNGINIVSLSFNNGMFAINGTADSSKSFYNFYKKLKNCKYIKDINFYYLNLDKKTNLLSFKLDIFLKLVW